MNKIIISAIFVFLLFSFVTVVSSFAHTPQSTNPYPYDNMINVDIMQSTVNTTIFLYFPSFNWTIGGEYVTTNGSDYDSNGSKSANLITPLPFNTKIMWYVNVTQFNPPFPNPPNPSINITYNFTTEIENAPTLNSEYPSDGSTLWDITTTSINITIIDNDTNFNWTINTYPDIGNSSSFNDTDGSKTCSISGLLFSTMYTFTVNATSFNESTYINESYTFNTRPAKLRENSEFNIVEKAVIGIVGIMILIGFLYIVIKTNYKNDKAIAKIFVGLLIVFALLTVIFSAL